MAPGSVATSLAVRELNSELEGSISLSATLQIQHQQQELQEFMTAGRDPRPQPLTVQSSFSTAPH